MGIVVVVMSCEYICVCIWCLIFIVILIGINSGVYGYYGILIYFN